jgi:manganese efflux pump family protein
VLSAVLLALALAMDATAVAAARGAGARAGGARVREAAILAVLFGGFQAGMAAVGWLAGDAVGDAIARWDHWIAFGLLGGLGVRMIVAGLRGGEDRDAGEQRGGAAVYLALAVATSLDAAAAGLTLPLVPAPPQVALALIGGVTAVLSAVGYAVGARVGARFGPRAEVVGGVVLVGVGVRILVTHLLA